ncbi:hypothetical protein D3C85_1077820 [compost metagenome]
MGNDFLCQFLVDAFLEHGFLLDHLTRGIGVLDLEALHVDFALDQGQLEDFDHRFKLEVGFGGQVDGQVFFLELEATLAFEVIAAVQLLDGVLDSIGDFVLVQFGYHVERRHVISP